MVTQEDEATIVVDVGSSSVKAGFSGEDTPRAVFPSVAEDLHLSPEDLSTYRARRPESRECYLEYGNSEAEGDPIIGNHPVRRGVLRDIDEMEKLMDNLFNFELAAYNGAHTPVLMVEPPLNERAQRQEMAAMMFETFKVPALSVCNSAVLAIFASGRTRGLALEVGGGVAHAVPVFEGFALNHAVLRLEGAGQDVTHRLKLMLEERGHHHLSFDTVRDIKEKLCYIPTAHDKTAEEDEYELPDGSTVTLDKECRSRAAELIFNPDAGGEEFAAQAIDGGLASMVMRSVSMCDKDINPDLLGSVVVAGGTTVMPGFVERLKEDLDRISPPGGASPLASVIPHPTSHEPGYNAQRKHAPWIGGSMLASLSPFKQLQVTRQEYEDGGESVIHRIFL